MSYHIDYPAAGKQHIKYIGTIRLPMLILLSLCMFFILVKNCWADGANYLQRTLFMGERLFAVTCLNDTINEWDSCFNALEAFNEFLRQLVS